MYGRHDRLSQILVAEAELARLQAELEKVNQRIKEEKPQELLNKKQELENQARTINQNYHIDQNNRTLQYMEDVFNLASKNDAKSLQILENVLHDDPLLVSLPDSEGHNILDIAVLSGCTEAVRMLIRVGYRHVIHKHVAESDLVKEDIKQMIKKVNYCPPIMSDGTTLREFSQELRYGSLDKLDVWLKHDPACITKLIDNDVTSMFMSAPSENIEWVISHGNVLNRDFLLMQQNKSVNFETMINTICEKYPDKLNQDLIIHFICKKLENTISKDADIDADIRVLTKLKSAMPDVDWRYIATELTSIAKTRPICWPGIIQALDNTPVVLINGKFMVVDAAYADLIRKVVEAHDLLRRGDSWRQKDPDATNAILMVLGWGESDIEKHAIPCLMEAKFDWPKVIAYSSDNQMLIIRQHVRSQLQQSDPKITSWASAFRLFPGKPINDNTDRSTASTLVLLPGMTP